MKILVVEENYEFRKLLESLLRSRSHEVTACDDIDTGLAAFLKEHHALVLVDRGLLGQRGISIVRKIRQLGQSDGIVILMLLGHPDKNQIEAALKAGAHDYLIKTDKDPEFLNIRLGIAERLVEEAKDRIRIYREQEKAENKFRTLVEELPAITYITDGKDPSRNLYVSPQIETLLGISQADWQTKPGLWVQHIHPDDRDRVLSTMDRVIHQIDGFFSEEYRMTAQNGHQLWFHDEATLVRGPAGQPLFFQGVMLDISQRKQAEEDLKAVVQGTSARVGEEFFRSLVYHLALCLHVKVAFVSELADKEGKKVRLIGLWSDGRHGDLLEYRTEGTPCDSVIGKQLVFHPSGIQDLYPDDHFLKEYDLESYLAIPLFDTAGRPLGHLGVMDEKPMEESGATESILRIFSSRAAAELQRKQAEETTKKSRSLVHSVLHAIPDLMIVLDFQGRYKKIFTGEENLLYQPMESLLGSTIHEILPEKTAREAQQVIDRTLDTGQLQQFEYPLETGGVNRWFSARTVKFDWEGIPAVLWVARDITKTKETETSLEQNENRIRMILENVDEIVYRISSTKEDLFSAPVEYVSGQVEEIIGYRPEDFYNDRALWTQLIHPDDMGSVIKVTQRVVLDNEKATRIYRMRNKNTGEYRWLEDRVVPQTDQGGKVKGIFGVARDITERKIAEAALQKSHDVLSSTLDQIRMGTVVIDAKGHVTFLNHVCERLIGTSSKEATGKHWEKLCPFEKRDKERIRVMIGQRVQDRTKIPVTIAIPGQHRHRVEIEIQDDPRDPHRRIIYFYDMSEIYDLRREIDRKAEFYDLIGKSSAMLRIYDHIREISGLDWTVLITGETGTGKELVARAIHSSSQRSEKPFIAVNCGGLTESILTSQLFGHKRGAFTGAIADQKGLIEAAHEGTLFLDELGDISLNVQTHLLRVLEEREITRLGEAHPRKIDVRIIAATHRNLSQEVKEGRFRSDLLYRLRIARIDLPSLKERREDIPLLVQSFLVKARSITGKPLQQLSQDVMRLFLQYDWPGNVRELRSAVDYAVIHCKGTLIQPEDIPSEILESSQSMPMVANPNPKEEKSLLLQAIQQAHGNRTVAARLLGISRATFYRRLSTLNIDS